MKALSESKLKDEERKKREHESKISERSMMAEMLTVDDNKIARGADELSWLAFETKMRDLIRRVLNPVIAMCIEDREVMFSIEQKEAEN